MAKFEVGEIAVLKHDGGGRLLEVFEVHAGGIVEKAAFESQQKYCQPWNPAGIVKVRNRDDAIKLVAILNYVGADFHLRIRALETEMRKEFEHVYSQFAMEEDNAPERFPASHIGEDPRGSETRRRLQREH